jgi:beta-lactamase regulating signal transducer with metallopeptidase domain
MRFKSLALREGHSGYILDGRLQETITGHFWLVAGLSGLINLLTMRFADSTVNINPSRNNHFNIKRSKEVFDNQESSSVVDNLRVDT